MALAAAAPFALGAGCFRRADGPRAGAGAYEQPRPVTRLQDAVWELATALAPLESSLPVAPAITLEFIQAGADPAGQLRGFSGCNTYFGTFQRDGQRLKLGPLGVTLKGCPEALENLERAYLKRLAASAAYRLEGARLRLLSEDGEELLEFTARRRGVAEEP